MNLSRLNEPITFKRPSLPNLRRPDARSSAVRPSRPRRSGRALVGLDIEPGQVVAAQARLNGGIEVERAAGIPLSPDVVRDGEVVDSETLTAALQELFDSSKLDRRVRIGIANQRIVVRKLELPPIADAKELETAVRFQAQDEIPMPLDSVVLDFHALGVTETPDGPRQQIVLVAARRDMVERVLHASRAAGLRPEAVDLSAFAMIRALRPAQAPLDEQVLYLAIGGLTNMAIAQGSVCQFTRVIGGGVEQIVAEVAERCAVPVQEARGLIASAQLDEVRAAPDEAPVVADATAAVEAVAHAPESAVSLLAEHAGLSAEPAAPPVAGVRASAGHDKQAIAHAVLVDGVHRIAAEVRNSLEFQRAQAPDCNVTRAVLCGPATDISGFDAALASGVGLPVSCGVVERASGAGNVPASRLAVAAGLAIEQALA